MGASDSNRVLFVAVIAFAVSTGMKQSSDSLPTTFEVASVKLSAPGRVGGSMGFQPGGRFVAANIPLRSIVAVAFGDGHPLNRSQIVGAPQWVGETRVEIDARISPWTLQNVASPSTLIPVLLKSLLQERFKLRTHREVRESSVYALVQISKGLGSGFRRSQGKCSDAALDDAQRHVAGDEMQRLPCGIRFGVGILSGGHIELPTLVSSLSVVLDRVVIDQTHLNGTFDVDLKWAPDVVQDDEIVGRVSPSLSTDTALADEPSIFTALQEQLGLKLQPSRSQVAVVVIDHIERLRDN